MKKTFEVLIETISIIGNMYVYQARVFHVVRPFINPFQKNQIDVKHLTI